MQFIYAVNPRVDGEHPLKGAQELIIFRLKCLIKARRDLVCASRDATHCEYILITSSIFGWVGKLTGVSGSVVG
jgi:hypothetical protein